MKNWKFSAMRFALTALIVLLLSCAGARAMTVNDCSHDQSAYGLTVAQTSAMRKVILTKSDSSCLFAASITDRYVLVMVKTDGCNDDIWASGADIAVLGPENRFSLFYSSEETAETAIDTLGNSSHILYAEPDGEISAAGDVNFTGSGASKHGFGLMLPFALREGTGSCTVAVVDSGIAAHSDLNGRVLNGYDYVDMDNDPSNDGSGHGTHVAGIIADCTQGTDVLLYSVRVLDDSGSGTISNTANAVLEAAEKGVEIINLSVATKNEAKVLDDAIASALNKGSAVVVSAGNFATDTSNVWPAHMTLPGVIVVGSTYNTDGTYERAFYSDYGDSVDVYTCGTAIKSCSITGGYTIKSGTSQSAPYVSAACALFKLLYGDMQPAEYEAMVVQASVGEDIPVLELSVLTPQYLGFRLTELTLQAGTSIKLPSVAYPLSCGEKITWTVEESAEVTITNDGILTATGSAGTSVTASCRNFDDVTFNVVITDNDNRMTMPACLSEIGEQAFAYAAQNSIVYMHEGIQSIAEDTFGEGCSVVLVCGQDTAAYRYAVSKNMQYIISDND